MFEDLSPIELIKLAKKWVGERNDYMVIYYLEKALERLEAAQQDDEPLRQRVEQLEGERGSILEQMDRLEKEIGLGPWERWNRLRQAIQARALAAALEGEE